ncbi:Hypothetical protein PHPALM_487 [Phytophthora palmivora]|uniref:RNase H type-1 domain-containing protein n=1 Tax=Phytophthora palmivora TaxID=4796 RepID=A0A2P4YUS9_9STRA|nr:Hypothetical protein PHPALM_487 [Phytophthora palmivora]
MADHGEIPGQVDAATRRPTIVWAAATALGNPDTTNNIAEFVGLQRLLQHAHRKKWVGLAVVGDSQLILTMLQQRKLPRAARLQNLYRNVRRLADLVNVTTWQHHYRRHNKMADWLANLAMDTKRSQASAPAGGASCSIIDDGLKALVSGDIAHWARTNGQ